MTEETRRKNGMRDAGRGRMRVYPNRSLDPSLWFNVIKPFAKRYPVMPWGSLFFSYERLQEMR